MTTVAFHVLSELSREAREGLLRRTEADLGPFLERARPIVEAVAREGDAALVRFAKELDGAEVAPDALAVTPAEFDAAERAVSPEMRRVLETACDAVRRFHEAQKPEEMWLKEMRPGVFAGDKWLPIDSVACYVPRGKGSFPSVAMMTAIPAAVAGVPEVAILTPPGPDGTVDAATLFVARLAGVERVYKVGGAQAVAAVAYGTETVPRCLKIVGPGSPWVVAAKRLLADLIDPGTPAGPSEAIILADETADGRTCALDLLIESEHGPDSSAWLVTPSRAVAEAARDAVPGFWAEMGEQRAGFSRAVLGGPRGGILLTEDMDAALGFVNAYAPEHLEIQSAEPFRWLGRIRNAGEILMGEHTPVVLGNFVLGPNAVLPTGGAARTRSALGVHDFMKRVSVGWTTREGYEALAPVARALAEYEGFEAHANAVSPLRGGSGGSGV